MSDPAASDRSGYSKDYWDIVVSQLRRRPSVRVSLVLLALLYGAAVYAPFLAGDRPLVIEATDAAAYGKAQTLLYPISLNLRGMLEGGPAARDGGEEALPWEAALGQEVAAVQQRVEEMRRQLDDHDGAALDELLARLETARERGVAGDTAAALDAAGQVVNLAKRARSELKPAAPGEAAVPGKTITLRAITRYPALDAISRGELYFMGLWAFVLLWPLWNRAVNAWWLGGHPERIRRARRRKLAVMLLLPLVPLIFWSSSEDPYATSPYKEGLDSGAIQARRVLMPPVAFGLAEMHDGEYFRPPTWAPSAEMDPDGRYVRGAQARASSTTESGFVVPIKPVAQRYGEPDINADARHPLGTDSLGRDLLARMIWGGRVSLSVGLVSTVFLVVIGTVLGALAGYYGGWVDLAISRVIEVFQCFPAFFLILIIIAFLGSDIMYIMVVLGVTRWPGVARLVRGEFLRLRGQDFVVASEALGVPQRRTIFRHVLPNAMGPVLVAATFSVASGILTESALSFLGLGVKLPVPSWGSLLNESRSPENWWIQIFPGLVIFLTVMLYNLLGEGVRDALDPRLKKT